MSTYYNEREQPTEVYFLDSAGCQVSRVDLLYDEAGRLVEKAQTHSDEVLPSEMLTLFGGGGICSAHPSVQMIKAGGWKPVSEWVRSGATSQRWLITNMGT